MGDPHYHLSHNTGTRDAAIRGYSPYSFSATNVSGSLSGAPYGAGRSKVGSARDVLGGLAPMGLVHCSVFCILFF